MKMYGYRIAPIDFWPGTVDYASYRAEILRQLKAEDGHDAYEFQRLVYIIRLWDNARDSATRFLEWEGDVKAGPFVFALPGDTATEIGVAWKQDNNGTTFVFSPYPLPWLEDPAEDNTCNLDIDDQHI